MRNYILRIYFGPTLFQRFSSSTTVKWGATALVQRINNGDPTVFTKLNISSVTWSNIAESVFHTYMPGTDRQAKTMERFSSL
jgi:hypothetical protein